MGSHNNFICPHYPVFCDYFISFDSDYRSIFPDFQPAGKILNKFQRCEPGLMSKAQSPLYQKRQFYFAGEGCGKPQICCHPGLLLQFSHRFHLSLLCFVPFPFDSLHLWDIQIRRLPFKLTVDFLFPNQTLIFINSLLICPGIQLRLLFSCLFH